MKDLYQLDANCTVRMSEMTGIKLGVKGHDPSRLCAVEVHLHGSTLVVHCQDWQGAIQLYEKILKDWSVWMEEGGSESVADALSAIADYARVKTP